MPILKHLGFASEEMPSFLDTHTDTGRPRMMTASISLMNFPVGYSYSNQFLLMMVFLFFVSVDCCICFALRYFYENKNTNFFVETNHT